MKRTKFAIISLLAMVCMIGTAFASFTFNDLAVGANNVNVTIDSAVDHGALTATANKTDLTLTDAANMPTIEVEIAYDLRGAAPEGQTPKLTVTVSAEGTVGYDEPENLSELIEFKQTGGKDYEFKNTEWQNTAQDQTVTVVVTPVWKAGVVDTYEHYAATKALFDAGSTAKIVIQVVVAYSA